MFNAGDNEGGLFAKQVVVEALVVDGKVTVNQLVAVKALVTTDVGAL